MKHIKNVRKFQVIGILDEVTKPFGKNPSFSSSLCNLVVVTKPFSDFHKILFCSSLRNVVEQIYLRENRRAKSENRPIENKSLLLGDTYVFTDIVSTYLSVCAKLSLKIIT
jgi:hypothetical protein